LKVIMVRKLASAEQVYQLLCFDKGGQISCILKLNILKLNKIIVLQIWGKQNK
jgi:hypothetical protein